MEIKKTRTIETSPSVVWNVLTNPEYIEKWLGVKAESDWKVNSDLILKFSWGGKEFSDRGKIIGYYGSNGASHFGRTMPAITVQMMPF